MNRVTKRASAVWAMVVCVSLVTGCGESEPPEITEDVSAEIEAEDQSVQESESGL